MGATMESFEPYAMVHRQPRQPQQPQPQPQQLRPQLQPLRQLRPQPRQPQQPPQLRQMTEAKKDYSTAILEKKKAPNKLNVEDSVQDDNSIIELSQALLHKLNCDGARGSDL